MKLGLVANIEHWDQPADMVIATKTIRLIAPMLRTQECLLKVQLEAMCTFRILL